MELLSPFQTQILTKFMCHILSKLYFQLLLAMFFFFLQIHKSLFYLFFTVCIMAVCHLTQCLSECISE